MMRNIYLAVAGCTILGYAGLGLLGRELSSGTRTTVSAADRAKMTGNVRHTPGGSRYFWHTGYHGGK